MRSLPAPALIPVVGKIPVDIRDLSHAEHSDIMSLNFIRAACPYHFRKHYREGLRSLIMEVLDAEAVREEIQGRYHNGIRHFPHAEPVKMLRIFKRRIHQKGEVQEEIDKFKILQQHLTEDQFAGSLEFITDYRVGDHSEMLLCGLQEYVPGKILDPWGLLSDAHLQDLLTQMGHGAAASARLLESVRRHTARLINNIKQMISNSGYIPDLSGVGNLILTAEGCVKLVDINNITAVTTDDTIPLDDKGYPACDRSIQVLALLEQKILHRNHMADDPLYARHLNAQRLRQTKRAEDRFYRNLRSDFKTSDRTEDQGAG